MRFRAKNALVTGAGRGIGRAIALRLAEEGLDITVNDVDADHIVAVVREIEERSRVGYGLAADVSKPDQVENLVAKHYERFGSLDVLINNAGIIIVKPVLEHTEEDWDRIFAVNFKSQYFAMCAAARVMIPQRFGKIINTSSMAAYVASTMYPAYSALKAATLNLTESFAKELAPYNIQVNAVCPGIIETEMWTQIDQQAGQRIGAKRAGEYMESRLERVAMRRAGRPEEVAATCAFLASSDADYITGQAIRVNGGMLW